MGGLNNRIRDSALQLPMLNDRLCGSIAQSRTVYDLGNLLPVLQSRLCSLLKRYLLESKGLCIFTLYSHLPSLFNHGHLLLRVWLLDDVHLLVPSQILDASYRLSLWVCCDAYCTFLA
jgi:hypothetical protein